MAVGSMHVRYNPAFGKVNGYIFTAWSSKFHSSNLRQKDYCLQLQLGSQTCIQAVKPKTTSPITMHGGRLNACALYEFRSDSTGHIHDPFPSRVAKNAKSVMFRHSNRRQRQDHRAIQQSTWQHRKGSYSHKDSQCDNTGCH